MKPSHETTTASIKINPGEKNLYNWIKTYIEIWIKIKVVSWVKNLSLTKKIKKYYWIYNNFYFWKDLFSINPRREDSL